MPKGKGYGTSEGMKPHSSGGPTMSHNAIQPKGKAPKGMATTTIDGVPFSKEAAKTQTNGGNYNEVGSTARKFG